jgi:hypothetical protein
MRGQPRSSRRGEGAARLGSGAGHPRAEPCGPSCVPSFARSPCPHADARLRPEVSGYKILSRSRLPSLPALPFLPPSCSCYSHPTPGASSRPQPRKLRPPAVRSRSSARARRQSTPPARVALDEPQRWTPAARGGVACSALRRRRVCLADGSTQVIPTPKPATRRRARWCGRGYARVRDRLDVIAPADGPRGPMWSEHASTLRVRGVREHGTEE